MMKNSSYINNNFSSSLVLSPNLFWLLLFNPGLNGISPKSEIIKTHLSLK
jgi:hypothetical protein